MSNDETEMDKAVAFVREYGVSQGDEFYVGVLADAYIAHLDRQAELAEPYDWEWLESLPQFDAGFVETILLARFREGVGLVKVAINTDRSFTWFIQDVDCEMTYIPAPKTKGDILKLLEVLS